MYGYHHDDSDRTAERTRLPAPTVHTVTAASAVEGSSRSDRAWASRPSPGWPACAPAAATCATRCSACSPSSRCTATRSSRSSVARSGGAWSPSAGSVYPTLQLLADEGLITAEETGGKKVFSLTEAGKAAVAETAEQPAPWDASAQGQTQQGYREAVGRLIGAAFQIGKNGTPEQVAAALEVLTDARKKLYTILAED